MTEAHAPGKLVVSGEYAVLGGAPAIAVAMDARARAQVHPADGICRLSVAGDGCWSFTWRDGLPQWREQPPAAQGLILEAVAATLGEAGSPQSAALEISLDTRAFQVAEAGQRTIKLGLGSSAALTVALTAALLAHAGGTVDRVDLFGICARAHRRFQHGAGSGLDVAAAVHGGVVQLAGAGGAVRHHPWPDGLAWLAIWSGESASTPDLLRRYEAFRQAEPLRFGRHDAGMRAIAAAVARAWERQELVTLLRALADYDDALRSLDAGAGLGIYTPAHERLARLAALEGAVYKVSGAGGGDFGIAFADSPLVISRIAAALARERVLTLPGNAIAAGVTVD